LAFPVAAADVIRQILASGRIYVPGERSSLATGGAGVAGFSPPVRLQNVAVLGHFFLIFQPL